MNLRNASLWVSLFALLVSACALLKQCHERNEQGQRADEQRQQVAPFAPAKFGQAPRPRDVRVEAGTGGIAAVTRFHVPPAIQPSSRLGPDPFPHNASVAHGGAL